MSDIPFFKANFVIELRPVRKFLIVPVSILLGLQSSNTRNMSQRHSSANEICATEGFGTFQKGNLM
jgi:hypothetical protein